MTDLWPCDDDGFEEALDARNRVHNPAYALACGQILARDARCAMIVESSS